MTLTEKEDGAGVGFDGSVGVAALHMIDVCSLREVFACGGGPVPAVGETGGMVDTFAHTVVDVEAAAVA